MCSTKLFSHLLELTKLESFGSSTSVVFRPDLRYPPKIKVLRFHVVTSYLLLHTISADLSEFRIIRRNNWWINQINRFSSSTHIQGDNEYWWERSVQTNITVVLEQLSVVWIGHDVSEVVSCHDLLHDILIPVTFNYLDSAGVKQILPYHASNQECATYYVITGTEVEYQNFILISFPIPPL